MQKVLAYSVVDVFAERALEGNPLAVFHDGRGLSDGEMQALARETNLSETTFILPAEDPEEDVREGVRVRIFTTEAACMEPCASLSHSLARSTIPPRWQG